MASVSKRRWQKPDGSTGEAWQVRYLDPATGKRPGKMFELKKDADAFRRKVEREIEDGSHTADGSSKTVKAAGLEFLQQYEQRARDGTVGRTYVLSLITCLNKHIYPAVGGIRLSHLTFNKVQELRSGLSAKGLAPRSVKTCMNFVARLEAFGRRRGYTKLTVVREVMSETPLGKGKPVAVPSHSEMARIMKAALSHGWGITDRSDALMGIMVVAASVCGLRYGEIMGLRLSDVDFNENILEIRQSVTRLGEVKTPKTSAGVRDVPMPVILASQLRDWIRYYFVPNDDQLIITTRTGRSISGSSFQSTYWAPLMRRAGLPDKAGARFRFHALRHFAASLMIEHNMPLTDVASLMGHAKFDMTLQVYAHPLVGGSRRADVIERMSAMHHTRIADASRPHGDLSV